MVKRDVGWSEEGRKRGNRTYPHSVCLPRGQTSFGLWFFMSSCWGTKPR
jgi:hypothetical protein